MTQLFILGNPRSGTSLLRLMLTCHPDIIIPPESHFFLWLEEKYSNWKFTDGLDTFLVDLYNSTKFETWEIPKDELKKYLLGLNINSYSELIEEIYLFYGKLHKKKNVKVWGDKNKLWKEKLGSIRKYYPSAKFIHLVRDGRDVACSFKELFLNKSKSKYAPDLPGEIVAIAERWSLNINAISFFLKNIEANNKMIVKYEELINYPEDTLKVISNFLELPFDGKMLDYVKENSNEVYEPLEFLEWKRKLNQIPDKKNIGKYKELLSSKEVKVFEKISSSELTKFGYE